MFTDPLTLTVAGVNKSFVRTGNDEDSAIYRCVDGSTTYTLELSHSFQKRNRCVCRLTAEALVADPLVTGQNKPETKTVTITGDWAPIHTTAEEQVLFNTALSFLTSANFLRLAGGET